MRHDSAKFVPKGADTDNCLPCGFWLAETAKKNSKNKITGGETWVYTCPLNVTVIPFLTTTKNTTPISQQNETLIFILLLQIEVESCFQHRQDH
jgi:hypothetical protein